MENKIRYVFQIIMIISLCSIMFACSKVGTESPTIETGDITEKTESTGKITPSHSSLPIETPSVGVTTITTPTSRRSYRLVYQKGASIYEMVVDQFGITGDPQIINTTEGTIGSFDISPDGRSFVVSIGLGPGYDMDLIRLIDYDAGTVEIFGDDNTHVATPQWSPSGEFISYIYYIQGITSIRIDPTDKCSEDCFTRYIKYNNNEDNGMMYSLTWIDDKHVGYFTGIKNNTNFCIGDIDSLSYVCPIRNLAIVEIAVSNYSDYILFTISGDDNNAIHIFNYKKYLETEETDLLKLTSTRFSSRSPIWTSDDQHFLFRKDENNEEKLIYAEIDYATMSITERILLINNDLGVDYAITDDDKMIAWVSAEFEETPYSSIFIYPIDINNPFNKVNRVKNMTFTCPRWMPIE